MALRKKDLRFDGRITVLQKADSAIRKLFANSNCDWSDAILVTVSPFRDICSMPSRKKIKPHLIGWWISFAGTDAAVRKSRMEWN